MLAISLYKLLNNILWSVLLINNAKLIIKNSVIRNSILKINT